MIAAALTLLLCCAGTGCDCAGPADCACDLAAGRCGCRACLVEKLGAPRWRDREAAHRALAAAGDAAWKALEGGAAHADAEIRARCARLLAPIVRRHAWELAGRYSRYGERLPWVCNLLAEVWGEYDLCAGGGSSTAGHYLALAKRACPGKPGDDDRPWRHGDDERPWRHACRLWLADQIAAARPRNLILADLETMANAERQWRRNYDRPPPPFDPEPVPAPK